jgi:glycerophosphoryl diester phosphodiesterase
MPATGIEESYAFQEALGPGALGGGGGAGKFVAAARGLGCPVHVWTVNDGATARMLWGRGVAGMVTNFPEVIRKEREK